MALATVVALALMGLSDPVLMTPAPAALAMATLGGSSPAARSLARIAVTSRKRVVCVAAVVVIFGRPLAFSARQCYGDYLRRTARSIDDLAAAARWNRADFTSRVVVSREWIARGRCDLGLPYAVQAYRLFPTSRAPLYIFEKCGAALGR